jgi:hypothetical protein
MTWEDRVQAVQAHRFTERQAGFLVTVMLHAGVCMERNYEAYAGIRHGQKVHDFFAHLVGRGVATAHATSARTGRLFHIHHKALYRAIGEPDNRHRRPVALPRAVERLMLLDAVLADRTRIWLATEWDKVTHFTLRHSIPRADLPALTFRSGDAETVRYFPDKLPIGVDRDGWSTVFVYLVTRPLPIDFRAFLERHAELWRALPRWTLRLLIPQHFSARTGTYTAAFHEQITTPLRPAVIEELRWFFQQRARGQTETTERYDLAARGFRAPRFQAVYRAWQQRGDRVLDALVSPVLANAVARGSAQLKTQVLTRGYLHLLALAGTA